MEKENRYRSSRETLQERNFKKLTESTNWYRDVDNPEDEENNERERKKEKESSWNGLRRMNRKRKRNQKAEIDVEGKTKIMSVIFIQHTEKSELAKRMREKLGNLEKVGNLKFKIVEKTGTKLEDLLHKSNAWSDLDCRREDCLMCESAKEGEKKGQCMKRNVVYETYCEVCQEAVEQKENEKNLYKEITENKENERKEDVDKNMKETRKRKRENIEEKQRMENTKKKLKRKEYKVKYIGETGRSGYERGLEHLRDFENCHETSHLLKHYLLYHKDIKKSDMKFGMRLRKNYRTPIERQIGEAVAIDIEKRKGTKLMNSRSEYNRCKIARISTKTEKETLKEIEKEAEEEERLKREMKDIRNRKREKRLKEKENERNNPRKKKKLKEREEEKEELTNIIEKEKDEEVKLQENKKEKESEKMSSCPSSDRSNHPLNCESEKSEQISDCPSSDKSDSSLKSIPITSSYRLSASSDLSLKNKSECSPSDRLDSLLKSIPVTSNCQLSALSDSSLKNMSDCSSSDRLDSSFKSVLSQSKSEYSEVSDSSFKSVKDKLEKNVKTDSNSVENKSTIQFFGPDLANDCGQHPLIYCYTK